jgi:putative sterol carrier protein
VLAPTGKDRYNDFTKGWLHMDENTFLQAIGQMIDEKFKQELSPIKERLDSLEQGQKALEQGQAELRDFVAGENSKTRTLVENKYDVICNLLKEEYNPMAEQVSETAAKVSDYDDLKSTVSDHADALENHNQRLVKLEQAI